MFNFPMYVGPWYRGAASHKEEGPMYDFKALKVGDVYFYFDVVRKSIDEDYEVRLSNLRMMANDFELPKHHKMLPMETAETMGQFIELQKYYRYMGYEGLIYFHKYSTSTEYGVIKFERRPNK